MKGNCLLYLILLIIFAIMFFVTVVETNAQVYTNGTPVYITSDSALKLLTVKPGHVKTFDIKPKQQRMYLIELDTTLTPEQNLDLELTAKILIVPKYSFKVYDSEDCQYSAGWSHGTTTAPGWYKNTIAYSNIKDSYVTLNFIGDYVQYVGEKFNTHGKVAISIDGKPEKIFDLYNPVKELPSKIFSTSLPYGPHTIRVRIVGEKNSASKDSYGLLDYFIVRQLTVYP